jgi:hypothetical protein
MSRFRTCPHKLYRDIVCLSISFEGRDPQESDMDTNTLLIIIVVLLVLGGGGFYGRGRWF